MRQVSNNRVTLAPFIANDSTHFCLGRMLCEIRVLETRLLEMGFDGDSAYEKDLISQYHDLIDQRREALARFIPKQLPHR